MSVLSLSYTKKVMSRTITDISESLSHVIAGKQLV